MAHFARLDKNNVVTMVIVVSNDDMIDESGNEVEALGVAICESVVGDGPWIQTSYNGTFRKQYAGIGYTYSQDADLFVSIPQFPSWILNDDYDWEPPLPRPNDGKLYEWDEETIAWIQLPTPIPEELQTEVEQLP